MSGFSGSAAEQCAVMEWSTGTANSTPLAGTAISMKNLGKALFIFRLGDMASETIDCVVETCDSNGSNNVTLKAATQLAASSSANDSKIITVAVEANELNASGKSHVRGKITTGGATGGTCSIAALGFEPRNGPASGIDNSNVVEVKT
jgi:hypothetical protein